MSKPLTVLWLRSLLCRTSGPHLLELMRRSSVRLLAKFLAESELLINVSCYHGTEDKIVYKIIESMVWSLTPKQVSAKILLVFYMCANK